MKLNVKAATVPLIKPISSDNPETCQHDAEQEGKQQNKIKKEY